MKYVKCIDDKECIGLYLNNVYRVINEREDSYLIDKGNGLCAGYVKERFIEVDITDVKHNKGIKENLPDTPYTPSHYKKGIETWDYTDSWDMDFLEGNIIKYVTRWKNKGGIDDLRKALMYLQRLLKREEKRNESERDL